MASAAAAVSKELYRSFLRIAKTFDRKPHLKALIVAQPSKIFDRDTNEWIQVEVEPDRGFAKLAAKFLRSAPLYKPSDDSSIENFVKAEFKNVVDTDDIGKRHDAAIAALSKLSECLELALKVPVDMETVRQKHLIDLLRKKFGRNFTALKDLHALPSKSASGQLLCAHPLLVSSTFGRSIVLVTRHRGAPTNLGTSSEGLVTNKSTAFRLRNIATLLNVEPTLKRACHGPLRDHFIHVGGPVPTGIFCLHNHATLARANLEGDACILKNGAKKDATRVENGSMDATIETATLSMLNTEPSAETASSSEINSGSTSQRLSMGESSTVVMEGCLFTCPVNSSFLRAANRLILSGAAKCEEFKFYIGISEWATSQLDGEFTQADWIGVTAGNEDLARVTMHQSIASDVEIVSNNVDIDADEDSINGREFEEADDDPFENTSDYSDAYDGFFDSLVVDSSAPRDEFVDYLTNQPNLLAPDERGEYDDDDYYAHRALGECDADKDTEDVEEEYEDLKEMYEIAKRGNEHNPTASQERKVATDSTQDGSDAGEGVDTGRGLDEDEGAGPPMSTVGREAPKSSRESMARASVWGSDPPLDNFGEEEFVLAMRYRSMLEPHRAGGVQRSVRLFHRLLDEEPLASRDRCTWGGLLRSLGGEYAGISKLAHSTELGNLLDAGSDVEKVLPRYGRLGDS